MARRSRSTGLIAFKLTVDPSPALLAKAYGLAAKEFSDWRPAWKRMIPHLQQGIRRNFSSRGGALGNAWPSVDPAYDVRKRREGGGRAQLVLTGAMFRDATGPSAVQKITKSHIEYGIDTHPQARSLNFGRTRSGSGRRVKKKPFMGWNPQMDAALLRETDDHARFLLNKLADTIERLPSGE